MLTQYMGELGIGIEARPGRGGVIRRSESPPVRGRTGPLTSVRSPVPWARNGVFASGAGSTYLLVTGFTIAGVAAAVGSVIFLPRTFRRRKAEPETPQGALNVS
jgi:hypothetical protein